MEMDNITYFYLVKEDEMQSNNPSLSLHSHFLTLALVLREGLHSISRVIDSLRQLSFSTLLLFHMPEAASATVKTQQPY